MRKAKKLEGFLEKMGQNNKAYKLRWFILSDDQSKLAYYKRSSATQKLGKEQGFIPITENTVVEIEHPARSGNKFKDCGIKIITTHRTYHLCAASVPGANRWLHGLRGAVDTLKYGEVSARPKSMLVEPRPSTTTRIDSWMETAMKEDPHEEAASNEVNISYGDGNDLLPVLPASSVDRIVAGSIGSHVDDPSELRMEIIRKESLITDLSQQLEAVRAENTEIRERYFTGVVLFTKLNLSQQGIYCNLDAFEMYRMVQDQRIPIDGWPNWVTAEILHQSQAR